MTNHAQFTNGNALETCEDCGRNYNPSIVQRGCPSCQDYSEVTAR